MDKHKATCDSFLPVIALSSVTPSSMPGEPVIVNIYDMVRITADEMNIAYNGSIKNHVSL